MQLTYEQLIDRLDYNQNSGAFTYKHFVKPKYYKGDRAGTAHHSGYRFIWINGKSYAEHRLAWLYINKELPTNHIDHIDRDRSNNKINNLRDVTRLENHKNKSKYKNNSTGYTGVYKTKQRYVAKIGLDSKLIHLGVFDTIEEAIKARAEAKQKHNFM